MIKRRELQMSDLGPAIPRWQPSYKNNLEYLEAEAEADRSAQELRRKVGENQSTTNYFDSETYYERQGKIFKPIIKAEENVEAAVKDAAKDAKENREDTNRKLEAIEHKMTEAPAIEDKSFRT